MRESIKKFSIRVAVMLVAVVAFYYGYSAWLTKQIDSLYQDRQIAVNHASGLPEKDKGNILLNETLKDNKLVFLGSSELSSPVPENPKNLIPNNLYAGDATFVGHAHVQNALFAMYLGANADTFDGKDIVIVESLQWFQGGDIGRDGFFANFSEMQMYQFLNNPRISEANKKYLCNRYKQLENKHRKNEYYNINNAASHSRLLNGINNVFLSKLRDKWPVVSGDFAFQETYVLSKLYLGENKIERLFFQLTRPYYYIRCKNQELKDKFDSYKYLKTVNEQQQREIVEIDWDEIYQIAEEEGMKACTNNDFYVYDNYYIKYLKKNWIKLKNSRVNTELLKSGEWKDFEFFLSVCKDLDIEPYIVSMSTNGRYYDYIGIEKEKRDLLYAKIEQLSSEYGYDCLRTGDKEYEPYFYCDVMHLGWKGWPYVLQRVIEYFS